MTDYRATLEGELVNEVHINTSAIPDYQRIELAKGALDLVDLAFAQPGAEERYRGWLSERRKKTAAK